MSSGGSGVAGGSHQGLHGNGRNNPPIDGAAPSHQQQQQMAMETGDLQSLSSAVSQSLEF